MLTGQIVERPAMKSINLHEQLQRLGGLAGFRDKPTFRWVVGMRLVFSEVITQYVS